MHQQKFRATAFDARAGTLFVSLSRASVANELLKNPIVILSQSIFRAQRSKDSKQRDISEPVAYK